MGQQSVELRVQIVKRAAAFFHQRFELGEREEHGLGHVVTGNGDRATVHGLLQDCAELVFDFRGRNSGNVYKLSVAISKRELRHDVLTRDSDSNQYD